MASKEATVYIVDQGSSTGECHNGRVENDLDFGMRYIWDKIAETMIANRTTAGVGVIGFRTDATENELAESDPDAYSNISVMKPLGPMEMSHLKDLQHRIQPSDTDTGDAVSAIVVGIQLIEKFTTLKTGKPGKFARKIILLTDGQGVLEDDDIDPIAARINELDIELVIVGIDFDDAEYGFIEKDKSSVKERNEKILKALADKCSKGIFGTVEEAIADLSIPRVKTFRPYSTFKGQLSLGDAIRYPETAFRIDVDRYFRVKAAKPVSASSFVVQQPGSQQATRDAAEMPEDLSAVKNARAYKINDPSAPGGKKDVDREELAKGYEYGRTAIPISEAEENVTKLETFSSFEIVGFIPNDKYEKFLNLGESGITIAQRTNPKAVMALSSFIHALHELDSYAVARIVVKDGKDPQLLLLAPSIEPDLEALIDIPLPFAEDVRVYRFPPLDRVITTSGATLTKHRYLPSDELEDAMSNFVNNMDISKFGRDDDDNPTEYMPIEDTYSPVVHRISQAIRRRGVQPNEAVTPPAEVLIKYSVPPPELISQSGPALQNLIDAADVKKGTPHPHIPLIPYPNTNPPPPVPPKTKGKRSRASPPKPLSGLDVESLLTHPKKFKLTTVNTIPTFKQLLAAADSPSLISPAATQMGSVIHELITRSLGDQFYEQALENLSVLREQMIEFEEPGVYNEYIRDLKGRLLKGELGEGRKDLWFRIMRERRLGLIDRETAPASEVGEEEAAEFYSMRLQTGLPSRAKE
ncbi:hypothetical protein OIDMADRAFT_176135 [Oidiodendron maius Zn]|uniref:ATP-dependent DNA helicase II subunit 2 n=1 Tax=Oidiodendron maius (strain Zn) TaxID=913774 RepID=A0A0C3D410_OIDMZ|nr:hypothetical protein OIDMADRAFT_176135 [Oidiodendron maius Zn]